MHQNGVRQFTDLLGHQEQVRGRIERIDFDRSTVDIVPEGAPRKPQPGE